MKFLRKSKAVQKTESTTAEAAGGAESSADVGEETTTASVSTDAARGPFDVSAIDLEDGVERIDLGGLIIAPAPGLELRMQVAEADNSVQSVMLVNQEGAVDLRAFAAPRNGDLWSDVRKQMAAETSRQGGTATEREGNFGTELLCELTVQTPDGQVGRQPSRVVGVNGDRWFLRATFLGLPAVEPERAEIWENAVRDLAVRRGTTPMAPGDAIEFVLPPQARRVDNAEG